jgi:hypothetical protein
MPAAALPLQRDGRPRTVVKYVATWNASTALTFLDGDVTSLPQCRYHDASS